jgi:hypothetical protein
MDAPIEITFRRFEQTDRIRAKIDELIGQLEKFEKEIISGRVAIEGKNKRGQKTVVSIHVELNYPGGTAVGKREADFPQPMGQRTFDVALAEAFHTAASQLRSHFAKVRPQEKNQPEHQPVHGRIERLNKDVKNGFIEMPGLGTLFFSEAVVQGDFDALAVGDEVLALPADAESPYGPQASLVKPIGPLA